MLSNVHAVKHGACKDDHTTKEYDTWKSIRQRCHNSKHFAYPNYGGAGIKVCSRWRNSFVAFLSDMGQAPSSRHTIERNDSSKGYSPSNCRWATRAEQAFNKSNTRIVTLRGRFVSLGEAAHILGWEYTFTYYRARRHGWNLDAAIVESRRPPKINPNRMFAQTEYRQAEYSIWCGMRRRCMDPKNPGYFRYGGAGISVCARWLQYKNFLADMGRRPSENHTLDRIDSVGNYAPDNCRWATRLEQGQNRTGAVLLVFGGQSLTITQWACKIGLKRRSLARRLERGWSVEQALSIPVGV